MATTTTSSLPLLPTEIKQEILRFCDPPSLRQAALASLAFLELAGPLLYDEIAIIGWDTLIQMFSSETCPRSPPFSHLASFLSLSQCRSFTFVGTKETDTIPTRLSHHRLSPSSSPIELYALIIRFNLNHESDSIHVDETCTTLLSLFNPVPLTFASSSLPSLLWVPLESINCPSLRFLSFDRCLPVASYTSSAPRPSFTLLGSSTNPVHVEFNVSGYDTEEEEKLSMTIACIGRGDGRREEEWQDEDLLDWVKEVTVRVRNENQRVLCEALITPTWEEEGLGTGEIAKIRERIRFLVNEV